LLGLVAFKEGFGWLLLEVLIMPKEPLSEKQVVRKAFDSFDFFVNWILPRSFEKGEFIKGDLLHEVPEWMQDNPRTVRISAKDHFKSSSFYAHFMWMSLRSFNRDLNCDYFSYKYSSAKEHLRKIKLLIERNKFFSELKDLKPAAEGVLKYSWDGKHYQTMNAHGMVGFKRGIHNDGTYVDDPFQDPESKSDPVLIRKVNRNFVSQVMDMPKKDAFLHVVGTPQTNEDFFFDDNIMARFKVKIMPAIIDEKRKKVLWPEHMPYNELEKRRQERGEKIFNQEYMCKPYSEENAWFSREKLMRVVDEELKQPRNLTTVNKVILGWDIGKKRHPSHISIFEIKEDEWVQRYQEFMDKWDYGKQIEHVNLLLKKFNVSTGFYDATRGELEGMAEEGLLDKRLRPVVFTANLKWKLAGIFDSKVTGNPPRIRLLNDRRMIDQILVVDSNLNARETREGHGESFVSIGLCFMEQSGGKGTSNVAFIPRDEGRDWRKPPGFHDYPRPEFY